MILFIKTGDYTELFSVRVVDNLLTGDKCKTSSHHNV